MNSLCSIHGHGFRGTTIAAVPTTYTITPLSTLFTGNTLTITGQTPTFLNGTYTASASAFHSAGWESWRAFNGQWVSSYKAWITPPNYLGNPYSSYTGSTNTLVSGTNFLGEWLQLQIPNTKTMSSYTLYPDTNWTNSVLKWIIAGSNDGSTWTQIDSQDFSATPLYWNGKTNQTFNVSTTNYSYYRLISLGCQFGFSFTVIPQWNITVVLAAAVVTTVVNSITYLGSTVSTVSGSLGTGNGIVNGTASTYNCYGFGNNSTSGTYVINYTCNTACTINILSVAGGAAGSSYGGGGGGAGGVYYGGIAVSVGTGTITINIGAGGVGNFNTNAIGNVGSNTTVVFAGTPNSSTITCTGGGGGKSYGVYLGCGQGSSGVGGVGGSGCSNSGLAGAAGGGGGAGGAGNTVLTGGVGIQVTTTSGVKDFVLGGSAISALYWGGGGGGTINYTQQGGNGGVGGGGGGGSSAAYNSTGGTGINNGGIGYGSNGLAGAGGANTGGGGGGAWNGTSGSGGSGIVVIAFPL